MEVAQYIRESCEHQLATTPHDFIGMALAWSEVIDHWSCSVDWRLTPEQILTLARLVNHHPSMGYRPFPATFSNGRTTTAPALVPASLLRLMEMLSFEDPMNPDEFYWAFEEIHPFWDGNGRVGSLIWNWMRGTLDNPEHPPTNPVWSR